MTNLTQLKLMGEDSRATEEQVDHGIAATAKVEAIFRNHRQRLVAEIQRYPIVVGCVAWLTDYAVLSALATRQAVSIVVQKEDFLKPDGSQPQSRLHQLYGALPSSDRCYMPHLSGYSYCGDPTCEPVRCVGNHNSTKAPAFPRMHNKFLVFCDVVDVGEYAKPVAKKVWTGSYNISDNATRSWENAVLIDEPSIADAYSKEFAQIFGFSEPLDWSSVWVEPQYRIGS